MAVFWSWLEALALATLVVSAATESDRADRTHCKSAAHRRLVTEVTSLTDSRIRTARIAMSDY